MAAGSASVKPTSAVISRSGTYYMMGRYDDAVADFRRAIDIDPSNSLVITLCSHANEEMARHDVPIANRDHTGETDPENAG